MSEFCWLRIFPWIKLSRYSCSMLDKPGWLNWFWQFLCEGLSSFHQKGFYYSYAWSCSLCEAKTSFWTRLISRKFCRFLLVFHCLYFTLCLTYFSSIDHILWMVFDSFSSNIDEALSINPSANVFVFGGFNIHHKDWLTYSGGTHRPGELCYNFSISNELTETVNFHNPIPGCDSQSCSFGFIYFFWG